MEGLTLVPETVAKPGYRFVFLGPNQGEECQGCPYQRLCFNLEPGRTYEIDGMRDVVHPCNLHDEGKVRVVTVKPVGFASSVEEKRLRGTAVTWTPVPCGMPECPEYGFCHPVGVAADRRYVVDEAGEAMDCPAGYRLRRVRFRP